MSDFPEHHKLIAKYLATKFGGAPKAHMYRDDFGNRPISIGAFGPATKRFYSTIGMCDECLRIPAGRFEFAALGKHQWLPNAVVTSVYWLRNRTFNSWPLVCEDAVKQNAKSSAHRKTVGVTGKERTDWFSWGCEFSSRNFNGVPECPLKRFIVLSV